MAIAHAPRMSASRERRSEGGESGEMRGGRRADLRGALPCVLWSAADDGFARHPLRVCLALPRLELLVNFIHFQDFRERPGDFHQILTLQTLRTDTPTAHAAQAGT